MAVAAAGWVGVGSPGDYAAFEFPPTSRHDLRIGKTREALSAVSTPSRFGPDPLITIPARGFWKCRISKALESDSKLFEHY
jgi:hypothetical protein